LLIMLWQIIFWDSYGTYITAVLYVICIAFPHSPANMQR
jgi:hypothetical protein